VNILIKNSTTLQTKKEMKWSLLFFVSNLGFCDESWILLKTRMTVSWQQQPVHLSK